MNATTMWSPQPCWKKALLHIKFKEFYSVISGIKQNQHEIPTTGPIRIKRSLENAFEKVHLQRAAFAPVPPNETSCWIPINFDLGSLGPQEKAISLWKPVHNIFQYLPSNPQIVKTTIIVPNYSTSSNLTLLNECEGLLARGRINGGGRKCYRFNLMYFDFKLVSLN